MLPRRFIGRNLQCSRNQTNVFVSIRLNEMQIPAEMQKREREIRDFHQKKKNSRPRRDALLSSFWCDGLDIIPTQYGKKEKRNTHETNAALSESDISFKKVIWIWIGGSVLLVFHSSSPPSAGCHRKTVDRSFFVWVFFILFFLSGCFSKFPTDMSYNSILSLQRPGKWEQMEH